VLKTKNEILKDRALMFSKVRAFFQERHVLEVDVPILAHGAPVDAHIDVMEVPLQGGKKGYLHTSPEYAMKRLLSEGIGDIYQMGHVFRDGECGHLHNPEFTMVEWYRVGMSFDTLIQETLEFIRLFVGEIPSSSITYRKAFLTYAGIDYLYASAADLFTIAKKYCPNTLSPEAAHWDKDTWLHFLMGFVIEPQLPNDTLTVFQDYPAHHCALAQTCIRADGEAIGERFEVYYQDVELANGFHELTNPKEQRARFEAENKERVAMGKKALPIDEKFLQALEKGLPESCGVAVGFDRLMLLRHHKKHIGDVIPFTWPNS
jgi:lysyl-tRNA synthetase class 2